MYNQTVADNNLSINIYGEFVGGGVCVGCKVNNRNRNHSKCRGKNKKKLRILNGIVKMLNFISVAQHDGYEL